jgi:P-type Cu2+ transporter
LTDRATTRPLASSAHIWPDRGLGNRTCRLCGLPTGRSRENRIINGEILHFCCPGCSHVFQILFNSPEGSTHQDFRETDLYRACVTAGLIPEDERQLAQIQARTIQTDDEQGKDPEPPFDDIEEGLAHQTALRIEGMWCSACSWLLEEMLGKTAGVLDAKVVFLSDLARIKYLPHITTIQDIMARISQLGYRASLLEDQSQGVEKRDLLLRLGTSAILTVNIMMISCALYFGFFQELEAEAIRYLSFSLLLLATPAVFYCGFPILKRAWSGLFVAHMSMDTLIAVGVLAAYFSSIIALWSGSLHLYFDTAGMLVTLVLLGRFIEARAKERVSAGITDLHQLASAKARLWSEGKEKWATTGTVQARDELLVLAAERVPVDGTVVDGAGSIDESFLTGESRPVGRTVGDHVLAGSLLLDGRLKLRATAAGTESSLNQMIALMHEALARKNPVELLADRVTRRFVPFILLLAAATAVCLLYEGVAVNDALLRAVTVLVITCPCALGIATPLAKVASIGVGRAHGILVRDPAAIETAKDLDVIIFDKTGTLTEGKFSLRDVITSVSDTQEALGCVASVEAHSDHLLAREIMLKAGEAGLKLAEAKGFRAFEGMGVAGVVHGQEVHAGNRQLIRTQGLELPVDLDARAAELESKGHTAVFFALGSRVEGILVFGDALKENAIETISQLRAGGTDIVMVSGDSSVTTGAVARELKLDRFTGEALPTRKVEIIDELQAQGHRVGMVGDGMNDAAALAKADVGIAIGAGSNITRQASDITLMSTDPSKVLAILDLSTATTRIIRQNLFFAFFYNIVCIPLAVSGALNPIMAVLAMFASSLTVIANTLRISKQPGVWRKI